MEDISEKRKHSAAHVLAMAVLRLFPNAKLGVGPVTKHGFYHDVETEERISWEDVKRIESEMNLIIQEDMPFNQFYTSQEEAFEILMSRGQVYKAELLKQIDEPKISFYKTGEEFVDLCRGPHVSSTNQVGAVKLTSISEVHWMNDEERPTMQRISGVAFATLEELKEFIARQEEIENRDFTKLGEELNLFIPDKELIFTPEGTIALSQIDRRITSGLESMFYQKLMAAEGDNAAEYIQHTDKIFNTKNRSYRNLPFRLHGQNKVHPHQKFNIHGKELTSLHLQQAVSYIAAENLLPQVLKTIELTTKILANLDLDFDTEIHTEDLDTQLTEEVSNLFKEQNISQTQVVNANAPKNGVQIKFIAEDELNREWSLAELLLKDHETEYVNAEGEFTNTKLLYLEFKLESILAYYLEHNSGSLPYWASPVQVALVPISEQQIPFSEQVATELEQAGLRTELDARSETMQSRIRSAEIGKVPVILVIGEKEENGDAVSIRFRNKQELGMVARAGLAGNLLEHLATIDK